MHLDAFMNDDGRRGGGSVIVVIKFG